MIRTKYAETVPFDLCRIPNYVLTEFQSSVLFFLDYPTGPHPAANIQISQLSSGIRKLERYFDLAELISLVISS